MKVLLTGAGGQLGQALARTVPAGVQLLTRTHRELDIADAAAVSGAIKAFEPQVLINAAAYTAVDRAESEPERAAAVNATGPELLGAALRAWPDARLVQISTDYVFSGQVSQPLSIRAVTDPISVYGRTKRDGERAVMRVLGARAVVVRTAWLYSASEGNFVTTILKHLRTKGVIRVVDDQSGSPTATTSVAQAVWRAVEQETIHGVLHWTDSGAATRFEFAAAIDELGRAAGLIGGPTQVIPVTSQEYPTPARRPTHCVLDLGESAQQLRLDPVPWRDRLREVIGSIGDRE